jgi:hypothetical protein
VALPLSGLLDPVRLIRYLEKAADDTNLELKGHPTPSDPTLRARSVKISESSNEIPDTSLAATAQKRV